MSQSYLDTIKLVAQQVTTSAESFRLVDYVLATIPYMEPGDDMFESYKALDDVCHYWDKYGCYEDELMPALSILHALYTYNIPDKDDRAKLEAMSIANDDMIQNPDFDAPDTTYEEFCDKFSHILNA